MRVDTVRKVKGYCGFCGVHCPVVTAADGARVLSVEPDGSIRTGRDLPKRGPRPSSMNIAKAERRRRTRPRERDRWEPWPG
jgi:hypothetical protein